ncbi:uncharacterized protein DUF1801 [Winogradskyella eximia]|uniref:Uncharacterized protein DUF1801 n=1 Tax=Winogradskyella eximia TaxID=262006 RepID=A0A3D9H5Q3_9FLAO|nr:DUF1801 domain-containing protein [Winogradskyella eximia]RED44511.1 uncharacterized protein DUF1801 [Winogradskyella eximia]|tara:strand:- start:99 stop:557 length:459 start_codon:yes stop_codon:yes gene_type:complete
MQYEAQSPEDYISQVPEERQDSLKKLRQVIKDNLPNGFEEGMQYKMIGYYVPHSVYPDGYHCDPKTPLPFMSFASQKNSVNLYHSGIYANPELQKWFVTEYPKHCKRKLDMGKSCIRFKKMDDIPFELIGELTRKMTAKEWISIYETVIKKK